MIFLRTILFCLALATATLQAADNPDPTQLAVWANEAIVATYTFDYQNFLNRQQEIAHYFTDKGWIAYSTALIASKLPDAVKTNKYEVSAVATFPPKIKVLNNTHWQAIMPLLVIYKNPQYQQKQSIEVTLEFTGARPGVGVRGLAIVSFQSKIIEPPCQCIPNNGPSMDSSKPKAPANP